jgi:hypothetical protein
VRHAVFIKRIDLKKGSSVTVTRRDQVLTGTQRLDRR